MKVLIADLFSAKGKSTLEEAKIEVVYDKSLKAKSLKEAMASEQPDVLVVRSTKVPKDILEANPRLGLVIRAGAGFDNIDFKHAASQGIKVANCPGKNSTAVAELALGLIIAVDRRIGTNIALLKEGKWAKG